MAMSNDIEVAHTTAIVNFVSEIYPCCDIFTEIDIFKVYALAFTVFRSFRL